VKEKNESKSKLKRPGPKFTKESAKTSTKMPLEDERDILQKKSEKQMNQSVKSDNLELKNSERGSSKSEKTVSKKKTYICLKFNLKHKKFFKGL
jgi:hypothetical protein